MDRAWTARSPQALLDSPARRALESPTLRALDSPFRSAAEPSTPRPSTPRGDRLVPSTPRSARG